MDFFYRPLTFLLLLIFGMPHCRAQADALSAIQKIYNAYNKPYSIHFNGTMKMYKKNFPGKIIERIESVYTIQKENFICHVGSVQMLLNDNYYVSADKSVKILVIGHRKDLSGTEQIPAVNLSRFKKWIKDKTIAASLVSNKLLSILQLTDPHGITGYNSYQVFFSSQTGYMQKVLLETSDNNDPSRATMVLEIDYSIPSTGQGNNNLFSEKQFFSVTHDQLRVNATYKNYQLINQL